MRVSHTVQADPGFVKAELRAGIANWRLGNLEAALQRVDRACSMPGAPSEAFVTQKDLAAFQARKVKVSEYSHLRRLIERPKRCVHG